MPQFESGDIVEYTASNGDVRVREVRYQDGERTYFTTGTWMMAYELRYLKPSKTNKLTGFAQWYKGKIDASV